METTMMGSFHVRGAALRRFRWCLAVMVLVGSLAGCGRWKMRDEGFGDDELSRSIRKARPQKADGEYSSLSEKGRQIERDLNAL